MQEIFKHLPSPFERYEISNTGKIKRDGKEMVLTKSMKGCYNVTLVSGQARKNIAVHKLVAIAFLDHTPNGKNEIIRHISRNKYDNSIQNLKVVKSTDKKEKAKKQPIMIKYDYTNIVYSNLIKRYRVQIETIEGVHQLGIFKTKQKAITALKKHYNS